jgi:hypothetical protein
MNRPWLAVMRGTGVLLSGAGAVPAPPALAATNIVQSPNFAGYSVSASTWVSSFQGSLTVPAVTYPATRSYTIEPSVGASERGPAYVQVYELISCVNG